MHKNIVWALVILVVNFNGCFSEGINNTTVSTRPDVVNIASILTFDSIIGKVAKIALEAAVEDVNSDPTILNGTRLNITLHDSKYSGFMSMMAGNICFVYYIIFVQVSYTYSYTYGPSGLIKITCLGTK